MKRIVLLICLTGVFSTQAQNNDESNNTNSPTWADKIPERSDAPKLNVDYQPETELDISVDDLGMERDALFDDEDTEDVVDQGIALPEIDQSSDEADAAAAQAEEEARLAAEAEAQRAAEVAAAEKAEQEKRLAEQQQKEQDRLAEEKRIADELAAQQLAERQAAEQVAAQQQADQAAASSDSASTYNWKRIKNVLPEYPAKAARNRDEGWVSVRVEIDIYGDVVDATVVDTYRKMNIFNKAALKAVRQWKFDPPVNYGVESNQTKDVRITFEL